MHVFAGKGGIVSKPRDSLKRFEQELIHHSLTKSLTNLRPTTSNSGDVGLRVSNTLGTVFSRFTQPPVATMLRTTTPVAAVVRSDTKTPLTRRVYLQPPIRARRQEIDKASVFFPVDAGT